MLVLVRRRTVIIKDIGVIHLAAKWRLPPSQMEPTTA